KLDLRIIMDIEKKKEHDIMSGELAKVLSTNESRLFHEKLKIALATKCHQKDILQSISFLPKSKGKYIQLPLIQLIGLSYHMYALSLINDNVFSRKFLPFHIAPSLI
ncbi:hypothetical protein EDC94DRAFT_523222, partial [Helicostylum pulchrum]